MLQPLGNVKAYFTWSPRLAIHYMMWFDPTTSSHLQVGFDSSDPAIVSGDLDLIQSMGVDVLFPDYYGRNNTVPSQGTRPAVLRLRDTGIEDCALLRRRHSEVPQGQIHLRYLLHD
jgi:hypothetical protein